MPASSCNSKCYGKRMTMKRINTRKLAFTALVAALAAVLSYVDGLIVLPVPGVKLGLCNIAVLFALCRLGKFQAIGISIVRVLAVSAVVGFTSLPYSLAGALLSFLAMAAMLKIRDASLTAVSIAGAAAHSIGQIAVAAFYLSTVSLFYTYLPGLLIISAVTGTVTGIAAQLVLKHIPGNLY